MATTERTDDGIERLRKIRGGNKAAVTKLERDAQLYLKENPETLNDEIKTKVSTVLISLKDKKKYIEELNDKILDRCDLDEIDREVDETTEIGTRMTEIITRLEIFMHRVDEIEKNAKNRETRPNHEGPTQSPVQLDISHTSSSGSRGTVGVRLPKYNLPRFNGDVTRFQAFWQSFSCIIDENEELPKIQKLNYLITSLEGQAFKAIEGLDICEENYEAAKDILKSRFGKTQQIISTHMQALLNLGNKSSGVSSLREIYDTLNVHIRGLKSLGVTSKEYGSLLIPVIMARMPSEISIQVARKTTEDVWDIDGTLEIIRKEIEAREMSSKIRINEKKPEKEVSAPTGTTRAFVAAQNTRKIECFFCKKEHYASDCTELKDIEKRKEILKNAKRCFICLKIGHIAKECRSNLRCKKCGKRHNTAICGVDKPRPESKPKENTEKDSVTMATKGQGGVLLQTARAIVYGEDETKKMKVNILFDGGSQRSYITESLKKKLGLKGERKETVNVNTFGTDKRIKNDCDVVSLKVEVENSVIPIKALSFPTICSPIATRVSVSDYAHLTGLKLADSYEDHNDKDISILVGANFYFDFITGDTRKGSSGPIAVSSKLGWLLSGPVAYDNENITCFNVNSTLVLDFLPGRNEVLEEQREITESLNKFWKQEACGLTDNESKEGCKDQEEKEAFSEMKITFNEKDSRYEVSLPWKSQFSNADLDSHYELSRNRLNSLYLRLKKHPELLHEYDNYFKEQIAKGIIEIVPNINGRAEHAVHYLCHHGVVRRNRETTKLRIVFDGSAKNDNESPSLNEQLEVGQNYMPLLFDTLVRFRMKEIGLTADVEAAFLQIQINETDKDKLRFLWFDDISKANPTIIELRHKRLVFGLTSSPSILGETIRKHVAKFAIEYPKVCNVLNRLYADDLSCVARTKEEALEIYAKSKEIMAKGGFNLRKWASNDKELMNEIEALEQNGRPQDESKSCDNKVDIGITESKVNTKVLGVNWNHESDDLFYDFHDVIECAKTLPPTKRSLLKIAAKIFDPIGALSLFIINLKVLFQDLCVNKVGWDEELQGNYLKEFQNLMSSLTQFHDIRIRRCIFERESSVERVEIHGFSDASEKAQGCVVYLRIIYSSGNVQTRLLASKAKVNPIKQQTIPRLELSAAVLLSKLVHNIKGIIQDELEITEIKTYYWVDSIASLCWIKNNKSWTPYIRNRVSEILKTSEREQWFYCPGAHNPADLPSRGSYKKCLKPDSFWWEGPVFLKADENEWPRFPKDNEQEVNKAMNETTKCEKLITHAMISKSQDYKLSDIIDIRRFSSKYRLIRTVAWLLRFINNAKNKRNRNSEIQLSTTEVEKAEKVTIESIQRESFKNEISYLEMKDKGKNEGRIPLYVNQFNLYLDNDKILRCRSRIKNANIAYDSKVPILLPSKHRFSELIAKEYHSKVMHNGTNDTLNAVREKYWIIRGRELVKKVVRRCILCKKHEGLSFKTKFCPDLPEYRVDDGPPFKNVGVDFAGPLMVENKGEMKCYVCLFTCASTRAVHLELVESLDVESFIRAFRRFTARRGLPALMISDNAKTYKAAAKEIKNLTRAQRLREYFTSKGVKWKFIIELAPWQGGMWERLIRSTKRCLTKVIGKAMLSYYELNTILVEVESVVNSRPLTYISDDEDGISYPLTPSQLINGRNLQCTPCDNVYEVVSTYESLSKRGRYQRNLLNQFSNRWKNEYLTSLLQAYRPKGIDKEPMIKVNDIVILRNDQQKRYFWKLAKVLELFKGKDESVRAAKVQVISKDGKRVLNRALKLLIPLEISCKDYYESGLSDLQDSSPCAQTQQAAAPAQCHPTAGRQRRSAAVVGELKRRDNVG